MSSAMAPPLEDALVAAAVPATVTSAVPSAVERHLCARINRRLLHRIPAVPPHIIDHEVAAFVEHHSLDFDKLSCRISNTLQYFDMLLDLIERRAAAAGYEEKIWLRHLREVDALYATADAAAAGVAATADDADGRGGDGGDVGSSRGTSSGGGTDADSAGSTIGGGGGGGGGGGVAQVAASFMERMKAQWASEAKTEAAAAAQITAQLGPDSGDGVHGGGEQEALSAASATSKSAAAPTTPFSAAASKAAPSTTSATSATSTTSAFTLISSTPATLHTSTSTAAAAAASTSPTVPTLPTTPSAPVLTPRSPRGSPRGTWVGEGWRTPPRTFRQMLRRRKPQGKPPHGNHHGKPSPNIGKHRAYSPASPPASSRALGGEAGKARAVDEEPLIAPLKEPLNEHSTAAEEGHTSLLLSPPVSPPPVSPTPVPLPLTAAVALVQRVPMTRGQIRQQLRMSEGAWSDLALWCTFAPIRMRDKARRAHVRRLMHGYEVRVQRAWALLSSPPP